MEYNDLTFARHLAGLASLNSLRKPVADPATLTAIQLVDKMIQIEDDVRTIYVRNDKPADAKSKDHRTTSLVLIFPLAVNLLYIPVLQKLLLLRMIVMLKQTTLKPMLLSGTRGTCCGRIFTLLAFGFVMCPPMLAMLPARVLHLTRLIHT